MAEMMEIYKKHAFEYDELVDREDYLQNLNRHLLSVTNWEQTAVIEAGIGTGRVSKIFLDKAGSLIGFDREEHMLKKAEKNLSPWKDKISLFRQENTDLPEVEKKADIFIEGWSFGHTMIENKETLPQTLESILTAIRGNLRKDGKIILIESLGTNVKNPGPPNLPLKEFYLSLQDDFGFTLTTLRTDYKFKSEEEAARICGFFFGEEMEASIRKEKISIIPEYTGVFFRSL